MSPSDEVRLRHMLDAAQQALQFAEGKDLDDLERDPMLAFAVIKCLEIVGEAASRIRTETRDLHPDVPWGDIVGMRNRLIHGYADIDAGRVHDTLVDDLPPLVTRLKSMLGQD